MSFNVLLSAVFLLPLIALADANNGEFMGYSLGQDYNASSATQEFVNTTGNLLITAEAPVKPDDIADVALVATPETRTIGYIDAASWFETEEEARAFGHRYAKLLRAKYPAWRFGREVMDSYMRVVEVSFENAPYDLRLQLKKDQRGGKQMWRFSMSLRWMHGTKEYEAWRNMSVTQQTSVRDAEREEVLKEADTRGL